MKKISKQFSELFIRYAILLIISLPGLWLFYFVFAPLTIYPVYFLLNLFFEASLEGNLLTLENSFPIELIGACIAGSAYYLLLILNLSTPKIELHKRISILLSSFAALLVLNILRIVILGFVFVSGSSLFDITHKFFWYFLSTIFVVCIWFAEVKFFKIKDIPFYSDVNWLYKNSELRK